MSVKSSTELMLYVVLTMPTLNKAYLFIYYLKKAFNSPNDHANFVHYLFTWGLPLINWYPMSKNTGSVQERTCAGSSL
jgi:hypothetical protein